MSESPAVPSPAPVSAPVTATTSAVATPTPTPPPPAPAVPAAPVAVPSPAPVPAASTAPVPVPATPVATPVPPVVPQPATAQAPSPAVATPPGPSPVVTPISTAVPTPAQAPSPAAASPAPQAPALSPQTIAQLAIFYASQHHQQALAAYNAKPTGNPPQPMSQQQAQQLFLRLPPQQQRQVQATFIARQRIAAQQATQSPQRSPTSPATPAGATPYHPSLLGNGGSTTPTTPTHPASQVQVQTRPPPQPQPQAQARPPPPPLPAAPTPPPARQRPAASQSKSKQQSNLRTVSFVPTQDDHETGGDRSRRREEGFRGSMRGEIATLMYAAGDVKEPDVDSVDFVEDMVVEFLADLCRPVPPIRTASNATHTAVPLSADTLRHRLASQPYLRKYLERWDDMTYMWQELQASRRVAQPNHQDLIADLGKQFLGLDEQDGPAAKRRALEGADGEPKRRGRPPKNPEERKKPGPKKGWKKNLDPNAPPKKRNARPNYKKRDRVSASIAPPSPSKASTPAP